MAIKANYKKASTLLPRDTPGIWWWESQDITGLKAKISTYGEYLKAVKELMDQGKLYKTFEYGRRDGNERKTVLYTDFLIEIKAKSGHRTGFNAIDSYDVKTKSSKYVRPSKTNARFWNDYDFR